MTYQLLTNLDGTTSLVRTNADGSQTFIPQHPANYDFAAYVASGVTATVIPLTAGQLAQQAAQEVQTQAQASSTANLTTLIGGMGALIVQAKADLATLSTATTVDPAIISRAIEGILALTQGLTEALIIFNAVEASQIPAIGQVT